MSMKVLTDLQAQGPVCAFQLNLWGFFYVFRDKLWNPGVLVTSGGILVSSQLDTTKRKNCLRFPELPQRSHRSTNSVEYFKNVHKAERNCVSLNTSA